jgi:DNA-binding NarL/FixJ family response regulator
MKRTLVAADQPLTVCGLQAALSTTDDLQVVATVSDLDRIEKVACETLADVLVLDLDAILHLRPSVLSRIKLQRPGLTIIVVGTTDDPATIRAAFKLGADGYHVCPIPAEDLGAGLHRLLLATGFAQLDEVGAI